MTADEVSTLAALAYDSPLTHEKSHKPRAGRWAVSVDRLDGDVKTLAEALLGDISPEKLSPELQEVLDWIVKTVKNRRKESGKTG